MSYTNDAVLAKLSAINESQESIVTVAQWIMFHKRHAEKTTQLWFQKLKDSPPGKRLNLIYLANEIAQQSRARQKDDFLVAYAPFIVDAVTVAYKGASQDVQQKLRRVIEVWRARQTFENSVQDAVEARVNELDKSRSTGRKPLLGGSLSGSSTAVPPEIQPLVALQNEVTKASAPKGGAIDHANKEFEKLSDPSIPTPTPPVQAARLSGVLKSLAAAEGAVTAGINTRRTLIDALEKYFESAKTSLREDETALFELQSRKTSIEAKKREVEDGIMRGLTDDGQATGAPSGTDQMSTEAAVPLNNGDASQPPRGSLEPEPPAVEALTPPSVEALTPAGSPPPDPIPTTTNTGADTIVERPPTDKEPAPALQPPLVPAASPGGANSSYAKADASSAVPSIRASSGSPPLNGSVSKKRKLDIGGDMPDFGGEDAMDGLDDDVAEMLRQSSEAQK